MPPLDRVRAVLEERGIPYALIGAAALAAHGVARSTFDIDLLTTDMRALDRELWHALEPDVDARCGDVDDPLAGVVRVTLDREQPIDIVVGKHAWQARAVQRARPLGGDVPVVLAADLILLKLYAGGAHDLWDVRELLRHVAPDVKTEVTTAVQRLDASLQQHWTAMIGSERS